jgi:hypothetical protein
MTPNPNSFNPSTTLSNDPPSSQFLAEGVVNCTGTEGVRDCLDRLGFDADGRGVVIAFGGAGVLSVLPGVFRIVGRLPNDLDGFID